MKKAKKYKTNTFRSRSSLMLRGIVVFVVTHWSYFRLEKDITKKDKRKKESFVIIYIYISIPIKNTGAVSFKKWA